jgi:hypothetical protein
MSEAMREKSLLEIVLDLPMWHRARREFADIRNTLEEAHRAMAVRYDANIGAEVVAHLARALVIAGDVQTRSAWIPEAPGMFPPVYANESDTWEPGKIKFGEKQPSTMDANKAKQFATRAECQAWCDANPTPKFEPREHGFDVRL